MPDEEYVWVRRQWNDSRVARVRVNDLHDLRAPTSWRAKLPTAVGTVLDPVG
jgi:hypothetical protein